MCEAFQATAERYADQVAIRSVDGAQELTFADYADRVRRIAAGLASIGVERGDTVALMMSNRPEFNLCDTAAVHLGATPFSVYSTSSPEQITEILSNAEPRVTIAEPQFLSRIEAARERGAPTGEVVWVEGSADGAIGLDQLEQSGDPGFDFDAAWRAVEPDDVLTLIYTSGTTGPPKGVELTHANMLAECYAVAAVVPIEAGTRITSFLPSAHIADRWSSHYNQMIFGVEITTVPNPRAIAAALPSVRPTLWGGVPRVLEKLKTALEAAIAADPDEQRRAAILKAIDVGLQKVRLEAAGEPVPGELAQAHEALDANVLSVLRERIGLDQVECLISGAAPLARDVQEFLLALGLPVAELYGMSECSCVATLCSPSESRVGYVGKPLPGVEVKVAPDGELLVRGEIVMRGYRGQPEKTAEALDPEGWLRTGDIGEIDDEGYVRVVDRKKELIINAAGKNMSPANIEGALKSASPLIGQADCIGDERPYNVALLVLDPDAAGAFAAANGLSDASVEAVAADERAQAAIAEAVERANERLSRVEQIKRYRILHEEWQPGGDELTPTMKLRRKPILEKYASVIEELYAD